MRITRIAKGYYKATHETGGYSNIRREGNRWAADIRSPNGTLLRYAGRWRTMRDAVEEVTHIFRYY